MKDKTENKQDYRSIISGVPASLKIAFNSRHDSYGYISNQLSRYERYCAKTNSLLFWSKLILIVGILITISIPVLFFYNSGFMFTIKVTVPFAVCLLAIIVAYPYMTNKIKRYKFFVETIEVVLDEFCKAVEGLSIRGMGESVGTVNQPMVSNSVIEKNLENEAFNIICWRDRVFLACEERIKGGGVSTEKLYSMCGTLLNFEERFNIIWNSLETLGIDIGRTKKSFFDQAKELNKKVI